MYRLLDIHGIYRKPSVTGVQALTLFSQLMHMSEVKGKEEDHFLQSLCRPWFVKEELTRRYAYPGHNHGADESLGADVELAGADHLQLGRITSQPASYEDEAKATVLDNCCVGCFLGGRVRYSPSHVGVLCPSLSETDIKRAERGRLGWQVASSHRGRSANGNFPSLGGGYRLDCDSV